MLKYRCKYLGITFAPNTQNSKKECKNMAGSVENSLQRMLEFCTQKQKVLSKNIANIGTEGYNREDIKFKDILNENISVLKTTNSKHIPLGDGTEPGSPFEIVEDTSRDKNSGINNVDIDTEMAEMAENTLKFKFAAKKMGDYYKGIQNVIKSGAGR